jgi:ferredoxin
MEIEVESTLCAGHGNCLTEAPGVFDMDADDVVVLLDEAPPAELHEDVRRAARLGPVAAIRIVG